MVNMERGSLARVGHTQDTSRIETVSVKQNEETKGRIIAY